MFGLVERMQSIDQIEVDKFSDLADQWWDDDGAFKQLHLLNPLRIKYIKDKVLAHFIINRTSKPFSNLKFLDIGCGGGILAEPLARLGGVITGIDASNKAIEIAKLHAKSQGLKINYINISAEALTEKKQEFDVVLCMEIIEHVADVSSFLASISVLVKPGGLIFIATINRTIKSYITAIVGAEYILRWLPIGTHNWNKFLKPSEIAQILFLNDIAMIEVQGFCYNLLSSSRWRLSSDLDVNYIISAARSK